jgi:hypothetical protein
MVNNRGRLSILNYEPTLAAGASILGRRPRWKDLVALSANVSMTLCPLLTAVHRVSFQMIGYHSSVPFKGSMGAQLILLFTAIFDDDAIIICLPSEFIGDVNSSVFEKCSIYCI